MTDDQQGGPLLASMVLAGQGQVEAVSVTDFVVMAQDISNLYLVNTRDGDVLINTGFPNSARRNVEALRPFRSGPLRYIILTQSHGDHYGGVPAFIEPGTRVIGGPDYLVGAQDTDRLQPYFGPRSGKLWSSTMQSVGNIEPPPEVVPDIFVEQRLALEVGQRHFELISTPEGETIDSLAVWMPDEKIVFTGNLFGPVWLSMPFLNTLRGDKPRLVRNYLSSLERVRELGAELLITGHGEPIAGGAKIRADLDRLHAAVSYVRDYTLDGMNAGRTVHQLMREFAWPEDLAIGEFHGKASWAVKSIWREYSGWFHYEDGTTELYGVPRSSVHAELVELAGGATNFAARARALLDAGEPLKSLHLVDIVLGIEPGNKPALAVKRDASSLLLKQSGSTNLSETMWLRSEIAECERLLACRGG